MTPFDPPSASSPASGSGAGPGGAPVLAIDIGGTKLAAAIVSAEGAVLRRGQVPTPVSTDGMRVAGALTGLIAEVSEGVAPAAVGVASAGPIDPVRGTVSPVNITAWRDFPLMEHVRAAVPGVPAALVGDAVAAAVGEHWRGAGADATALLGIVVSTGIGGGLVLDGRPYPGPTGNAGHFGHITVDPTGPVCACGGRGCVETLSSGPSLVRWARAQGWRAADFAAAEHAAGQSTGHATEHDAKQTAGHADEQTAATGRTAPGTTSTSSRAASGNASTSSRAAAGTAAGSPGGAGAHRQPTDETSDVYGRIGSRTTTEHVTAAVGHTASGDAVTATVAASVTASVTASVAVSSAAGGTGERGGPAGPPDAGVLAADARAGDPLALAAFERGAAALATGIVAVATICDLDQVVVGGGVSKSGEILFEPLLRHVRERAHLGYVRRLTISPAALGTDAGLVGAARVALDLLVPAGRP
ncbi:hypothetical protein Misp01_60160 [Microtetraspora sp. NBRC 13810]|uniref:ROK family protein n=1 Tax=Microtetraspora sp. NBRC 13810 TaxID=3030990 RepID=UPI0024A19D30|nr:ROK family protein [Microtetraspora sp. NBRC 13810]GLW10888.1 hypothetical protein Misp01_60160 [Microtetraspora sp. NBRC 13810]